MRATLEQTRAVITVAVHVECEYPDGRPLTVVVINGEIDTDTVPLVELALMQAMDRGASVCCDLSGVTFFGAAASQAILDASVRAFENGQLFSLRGATPFTTRVLDAVDPGRLVRRP